MNNIEAYRHATKKRHLGLTIGFVVLCEAVGVLSGLATSSSVKTWYLTLSKPAFNPPDWLFAPVWITLYALMGIAGARLWKAEHQNNKWLLKAGFFVQLFLNGAWSLLFFGMRLPQFALFDIILLWFVVFFIWFQSKKFDKLTSVLLLPYLVWLSLAVYLNAGIVWLN